MTIEVKVPELPESVTEATVGEWLKNEGDKIARDENIVDLETDKVMLEVPATANGVLKQIKVQSGETVTAGQVLAVFEQGEASDAPASQNDDSDQKTASQASDDDAADDAPSGDIVEVKVPELPESVTEATVGEWLKNEGDQLTRDENIVDLETDKVMLEVPVTDNGVLKQIKAQTGETVTAGQVIAVFAKGGSGQATAPAQSAQPAAQAAGDAEAVASPAARKLMDENSLSAADIAGTGKDGRITKPDVTQAMAAADSSASKPQTATPASDAGGNEAVDESVDLAALSGGQADRVDQRVPMTRIRLRIAERLLEVTQNTAMLTTFNDVDMQAVFDLRNKYKDQFEKSHDVRLGFMSFFVKAAVEALKRFPVVNATLDGSDIVYHNYYDIGIAVSSPRGLLVPILRNADQLGYAGVESGIRDLGKRARDGKVGLDELTGGTFTITNGGVFGSLSSTPLLNPPQSAILGMHAINDTPRVVDGEIVIRPVMNLALSYDHRLVDGSESVKFLRTIKELLEDPARLLLQV